MKQRMTNWTEPKQFEVRVLRQDQRVYELRLLPGNVPAVKTLFGE